MSDSDVIDFLTGQGLINEEFNYEAAEEFINHYGTKGMHWGVRTDKHGGREVVVQPTDSSHFKKKFGNKQNSERINKAGARAVHKADAKFDKVLIKSLNPKYKGEKFKIGSILHRQYVNDAREAYANILDRELQKAFLKPSKINLKETVDKRGTVRWSANADPSFELRQSALSHENVLVNVELIFDSNGFITKLKHVESENVSMNSIIETEKFLEHFGIKGQKWGVRRRTPSGGGSSSASSGPRAPNIVGATNLTSVQGRKQLQKNIRRLSNDEIKDYITRLDQEKRLKSLLIDDVSSGQSRAKRILNETGDAVAKKALMSVGLFTAAKVLEKAFKSPKLGDSIRGTGKKK